MFTKSFLLLALATTSTNAMALIQPELEHSLRSSTANIIVTMKGGVEHAINQASEKISISRTEKITYLADTLIEDARMSQMEVMNVLSRTENEFVFESLWASNTVYVENASNDLVAQLAALDSVEEIHQEHIIALEVVEDIEEPESFVGETNTGLQWGIDTVKADKVWASGNTGEGIIVSSIDTGVRVTHDILADNYVGKEGGAEAHGWLDPYAYTTTPNDGNGHGTHTMGTIAGSNGFGVAPGVKWMACKGCSTSGCTEKALLKCGEYTLCPTDTNGENKNCALAPHISSNSWGGGANQMWYMTTVQAWRAAGIIPVFAMGNSGPSCGTANSPGDYDNVIAVGASTSTNSLASFSSVGPTKLNAMKPEVSAPGQSIKSAWFDSDNGYSTISGTSMACPHVAGAIALMIAEEPTLDYDGIYNALTMSCNAEINRPNKNCGGVSDETYPNNMFGWGVLHTVDAIASIGGTNNATNATTNSSHGMSHGHLWEPTYTPPTLPPFPPMECLMDIFDQCVVEGECWGASLGSCVTPCWCI